jgi:hypothetical protein
MPRVKIHNASGKFIEVVAGSNAFASNTMGIDLAVHPDGRILALDPIRNAIRVFRRISNA